MDANPGELFVVPKLWADMDDWHARVAALRAETPVIQVDLEGFAPFTVLTRHEDIAAVERDHNTWLNTPFSVLGPQLQQDEVLRSGMPLPASLVQLDGHKHRTHRAVTSDWFKPAVVGSRQERIEQIAQQYVDKMRELGDRCDFAADIAQPYTLHVIMEIYGVPEKDEPLMRQLTQGVFGAADPEFGGDDPQAAMLNAVMTFISYFNDITADRKAHPRDDLASVIANAQIEGEPIGDVERLWYYIIVATAGHDTTSYGLSGGVEALLRTPGDLFKLAGDPDRVVRATEEIIRWTTPVRHFLRYATCDTEVRGVPIPEGGRVLLSYPSANRDEQVFKDSMTFDVDRADADKQLSFGAGVHFCLGAHFARREIRTMIGKLAAQLRSLEPNGTPQWSESHFVSGVKHLPIGYRFK
ncbi:MAG TPA: cytochrome P450 [Acidimicrobiales bacterium]|nr:cytochrome P450 [Acidimicrobiales bacterium]